MPLRARLAAGQANMSTAPELPKEQPGDEADDVLFNSLYGVRTIELNRPKKLNSLNGSMARKILPRLKEWEKSQLANIIMISGAGGKAFCAGGDVAALAKQNQEGKKGQQKSTDYFGLEYQLDHLIATYSKPYIAVLDGITMGGGVGLSVHAPFRIATERTVFAMPETTIGFFPDVGGSFFLPRLDGEIGTYLALTSERLTGVQAFYSGIATHYLDSSALANLTTRLSELVLKDYATLPERLDLVNQTIAEFSTGLPPQSQEQIHLAGSLRSSIDRHFKHNSIPEILASLSTESENKAWADKTIATLTSRSPTSLMVTLRQLRLGRNWSISETFQREHKIAEHFMSHPDFTEGVSARLMSKPPREPTWSPPTLSATDPSSIDPFFTIPSGTPRLPLFGGGNDYKSYPHERFALPAENVIERFVRNTGSSRKATMKKFVEGWGEKEGVREKVTEVLDRKTVEVEEGLRWIEESG